MQARPLYRALRTAHLSLDDYVDILRMVERATPDPVEQRTIAVTDELWTTHDPAFPSGELRPALHCSPVEFLQGNVLAGRDKCADGAPVQWLHGSTDGNHG